MNAVERLNAAIEKLETLKAESTPGRWATEDRSFGGWFINAWFDNEFNGNTGIAAMRHGPVDAELIVTLHRTIDAQLAILRDAANVASEIERFGLGRLGWGRAANGIALASAILGEP